QTVHTFRISGNPPSVALIYLNSLVDANQLSKAIIGPLNQWFEQPKISLPLDEIEKAINVAETEKYQDLHTIIEKLLSGMAVLLVDQSPTALGFYLPGFPRRQVTEPPTERVVRGSREGFTDVLTDNLGMVRRWIKDPNLRIESMLIGERTKTTVALLYLNDVANPDLVREVKKRLAPISIDAIIDSGYLSELITDHRLTVFPLVQETERPDKVAAGILEGRVAIIVDKSPFALIVPVTSNEFYQTPEDFYLNYWVGTFIRFIRGIGTFISVTLPGFYVAAVSVNPTILPASFIHILSAGRTQVPVPVVIETYLSLFAFEIFRESIIRVPKNISLILGIAGGVLMGLVAMNSGLVGGATIIVVIFTTLATFTTASVAKEQAWRITRYLLLLASGAFGITGLTLAGVTVIAHLASLTSFGVSYLAPWSPPLPIDIVDAYFRTPWWASYRRPPTYRPQQEDRLGKTTEGDAKP
ncbi:MAG TPA: spore germination protein, partial [Bacillota bacterium]|nr:spore germination protein [Bacillota bacterium]